MPEASNSLLRPCEAHTPVVLLGIPLDHNSSHLRGPRLAPAAIRSVLTGGSMNWSSESRLDLAVDTRWGDAGDVTVLGTDADMVSIEQAAAAYWSRGARLVCLGGDHSITAPIMRGARARYDGITIVHFDAHPDLYPQFDGNRNSHASPFYRIMEEGLAKRLIQIGVRTINTDQQRAIERFNVEVVTPEESADWKALDVEGPVYVSIDLDVLDPAFAPGVSHHEPGGLSVREVLTGLRRIRAPLIGGDIVELNPERDPGGRSAAVAAKLLKELLAVVLERPAA